jgi:hypothetical protein
MKINQIGIQSYQQISRQDPAIAEQRRSQTTDTTVQIEPQAQAQNSSLAVKASGADYLDSLNAGERKALETLFSRFRDSGRFGANYKVGSETANEDLALGTIVDVKV